MSRLMKLANGTMLVLFVSWAAFQSNDPDPIRWVLVYLAAATLCVLRFLDRFPRRAALVYVGACLAWAAYLGFRVVSERQFFFDENGREAMGLTICAVWTFVLWRISRRKAAPQPAP